MSQNVSKKKLARSMPRNGQKTAASLAKCTLEKKSQKYLHNRVPERDAAEVTPGVLAGKRKSFKGGTLAEPR